MTAVANAAYMPGSTPHAMKGLAMERQITIQPGQILYRFVDITRAPGPIPASNGSWWFEFEPFQPIKHFGVRHGHSLEYSARLHAAILYEWSEVTGDVRAEVLEVTVAGTRAGNSTITLIEGRIREGERLRLHVRHDADVHAQSVGRRVRAHTGPAGFPSDLRSLCRRSQTRGGAGSAGGSHGRSGPAREAGAVRSFRRRARPAASRGSRPGFR